MNRILTTSHKFLYSIPSCDFEKSKCLRFKITNKILRFLIKSAVWYYNLSWENSVLHTHNLDCLISIFTLDTFNSRIYRKVYVYPYHYLLFQSHLLPLTWNYYYTGYRLKIKLICRLTRDPDQALISIFSMQEFSPICKIIL